MKSTRAQVITMGRATMVDRALQFATPIVLVRLLDVGEFGYYRIFWLIVMTVTALAPLGMTRSLLYFLPRANVEERRIYITNTLIFLLSSGLICAIMVAPWNPLVTERLQGAPVGIYVIPLFLFLWIVASLLDILPNADQHFKWQANSVIGLSIVRFISIAGTAALTRDINKVYIVLLVFVLLKIFMLLYYVVTHAGSPFQNNKTRFMEQLRYSIPFGIEGGVYNIRSNHAEQWVVALLFQPGLYAIFSVSNYVFPIVEIIRGSVSNVLLPKISKLNADGDIRGMLALNNKGSLAAAFIIFPVLAYLLAFTDEVVKILFTEAYREAAPVMRIYILGMFRVAVEVTTILIVFRQGKFVMKLSLFLLIFTVSCSYSGAKYFGLMGAALGSVIAFYLEAYFSFSRAARLMQLKVKDLQDWRGLATLLAASGGAGIAAWGGGLLISQYATVIKLGIGGLTLGAAYCALLFLFGYGWIFKAYLGKGPWKSTC